MTGSGGTPQTLAEPDRNRQRQSLPVAPGRFRGGAVDDGAVDGDVLAGPDADEVADGYLVEGHVDLDGAVRAVAEHAGGGGGQADQGLDGGGGPLLGLELEPAAHQDEGDHDERGLEVQVHAAGPSSGIGRARG